MKRFAAALVVALLAGCAAHTAPPPPVAGGYASANPDSPGLKAARDLAIAEVYKRFPTRALVASVAAQTQVVAGLNYKFHIVMSGAPGAVYDAVVYRDLQGHLSVTSLAPAAP